MSVIRILPEAVANRIAAGEVVERPASVVKELLENSLDAGAERVEIYVEAGGKRLIRVDDDGCGMNHDDALLAFERHATSKIRDADDLFAISTLGFRGEALPSIAAVSRLALTTRDVSEAAGSHLEIAGGKLRDVKEIARHRGTLIEVRDLFFNTPARRKFLKAESTELGHIATLVTHYALAHPERSFRLASLTNEIISASPVGTSRERVYQLMGGQLLEQMVDIAPLERALPSPAGAADEEPAATESPVVKISGFISRPEVQKLNRNNIYFFVNRRLVRDRLILHAVTEAYRNILPSSVFPVALIFLQLPASQVDVNVHPSKTEVRFRSSSFIHDFVRDSIRQSLVAAQPVAAFPQPRRAASAGQDEYATEVAEKLAEETPVMRGAAPPPLRAPFAAQESQRPASATHEFALSSRPPEPVTGKLELEAATGAYAPVTPAAGGPEAAATQSSEFPRDLEPLGQVQESFIVATNSEGLWIIDQHVAHERILFERHLKAREAKRVEGQRLLLPIVIELNPEQQVTFQEIAQELSANGFDVEPFGQRTVAVKTAPADIRTEEVERLLLEILDGVGHEARGISLESLRGKIAASVSCHAAIKINMALDETKMNWLLRELARTDCPMTCPHGRPVVLKYSMKDIQKAFKRI
jgi:DNA mismatch repair protein MutL